jgi:hypothetical protein
VGRDERMIRISHCILILWRTGHLASLIKVVNVANLPNVETSLKIEGCEYLALYNWLDRSDYPTILVPGMHSSLME